MLREPNIFKIVGRSHYERWHSCFWGWLLDPNGTHLLSDYALRRLLVLLSDERTLKPKTKPNLLNRLPVLEFSEVSVFPNENVSSETSVQGVGRFDVFLSAKYTDQIVGKSGASENLNVLFEFKIDSKPTEKQSRKYADWLLKTHSHDRSLLVYVTPVLFEHPKRRLGMIAGTASITNCSMTNCSFRSWNIRR